MVGQEATRVEQGVRSQTIHAQLQGAKQRAAEQRDQQRQGSGLTTGSIVDEILARDLGRNLVSQSHLRSSASWNAGDEVARGKVIYSKEKVDMVLKMGEQQGEAIIEISTENTQIQSAWFFWTQSTRPHLHFPKIVNLVPDDFIEVHDEKYNGKNVQLSMFAKNEKYKVETVEMLSEEPSITVQGEHRSFKDASELAEEWFKQIQTLQESGNEQRSLGNATWTAGAEMVRGRVLLAL